MARGPLLSPVFNRDVRLDFIRGLALYMVLFDHVTGDPLKRFTYRVLGFSDAAEIFVFVSGLTCGLVYYSLFRTRGWRDLFAALSKRAVRIFAYFALSEIAVVFLFSISHSDLGPPLPGDIISNIWFLLGVIWHPPIPNVLLLYLPLTLIALPLFFLAATYHAAASAFCISGLLWLTAQFFPQLGAEATDRIFFNPLAWQLLFLIGLSFGMQSGTLHEQSWFKRNQWLVAAAWLVVGVSFAWRFSFFVLEHTSFDHEWLRISNENLLLMKQTLSPVRLLHFLSVAFLFSIYVRRDNSIIVSFPGKMLTLAGRRSLEMYSLSLVLGAAANVFVAAEHPSIGARLVMDCALTAMMGLAALAIASTGKLKASARNS